MGSRKTVVVAVVSAILAIASAVSLLGCAPASLPDLDQKPCDPNATRVAFYGDSYTLGTGASEPSLRWSTVVCDQRGWSEFNPSVNGLGFINNRSIFGIGDAPSQVIDDDPEIVFITMGLNRDRRGLHPGCVALDRGPPRVDGR
jgi:hypothetical protein